MALDATVGTDTATSYVTVTEAYDYFSTRLHADAWFGLADQDKALITASSVIDWYSTWKGLPVTGTQSKDWPRTGVYNKAGELYLETVIPQDVKIAVFEYALSSLDSDRTADNDLAGLSQVAAGSLMLKVDDSVHNTLPDTLPDKIGRILRHLVTRSGVGVVRLIRA